MRQTIKCFVAAFVAVLMGVSAFAQVTTASMSGKVTDANGALQGVAVVAVHEPTGSQFYSITDASGRYYLSNITAGGPYNVKVSCLGYRDVIYTGISVSLSDNYVLNVQLDEESLSLEGVTVSAEATTSNMSSDRAGSITSMGTKEIASLPTISRSLNDVLMQTPQSYVSGTKTYIGGGSYRDSYVTVDGAAFNNAFGIGSNLPAGGSPISLDAVEQIAVAITPYDVRQSGFTGGGINAITRSGTNEVKATVYGYFRNQEMQGYQVADFKPLTKTDNQYLMYGASVGAPIIKDKLFIFLNVEADQSVEPGPTRMLTDRYVDESGQLQLTPDGNVFTTGNDGVSRPSAPVLDAVSKFLKDKYGYDTGAYTGYNTKAPSLKLLARIDWNINNNHKLNVRYSYTQSKYASNPSTSRTGIANSNFSSHTCTSMYALYFQNARYYQEQNFSSVAAELNSRFLDGKLNNTLRVSYSNQNEPRSVEGGYFPYVDLVVGEDIYTTFGYEAFSYGNLRKVDTVIATDEITWNFGKHNILGGIQFEYNKTQNGFQRFGAGYYQYNFETEQALYDAAVNGTLFNDPVQFAITHGNNSTFAQEYPNFQFGQASLYLQDNIAFSDNFKLTAGIRFELPFYPSLDFNRNTRVEEATFAATPTNPTGKYNTVDLPKARLGVSPRIGFNWDILGDRRFVLRGGSGLFTGRIPFVWIVSQSGDAGVLQTTVTRQASLGQSIPEISADRNAILNQIYPNGFSPEAAGLNLTSITLMDQKLSNPMSWKSSLAFDAKIPGGFLASVEAIYKKDINPVTVKNIGLKSPTVLTEVPDVAARPYYGNGKYDSQITDAYLLYNVRDPKLWGDYFSVTAKLEKTFWKGLAGSVSYTYSQSKVLSDGVGDQLYSVWKGLVSQMGTNNPELGYASYVMPHRIVGNLSYSVDYGKYFGTSVSLAYYGGPNGRTNTNYTKNVYGDGAYSYSLIDIPTYDDLFGEDGWKFSDIKDKDNNVTYSAKDQKKDFWAFIQSNDYLKNNTGKVAERNGIVEPWTHRFDFKINQNFYFFTGKNHHKHTVQLGLDIKNVGNLLNKNWGAGWYANANDGYGNIMPLNLTNAAAVYTKGEKPVFQYQKNGSEVLKEAFVKSNSLSSTWQMIFNVRYIF